MIFATTFFVSLTPLKAEDNIGDKIFDAFLQSHEQQKHEAKVEEGDQDVSQNKGIAGNPIQFLEMNWKNDHAWPMIAREYRDDIARVREEKSEKWFQLMLTRIQDAADLTLLRSDGSQAGSFQQGDLSTGQKNTAVLSLLLSRGSGPVLIDQPEDELDSEFLYKELVPLFRSAKRQRQLIIVTHNANIPVNADAELVYALKAEGGRGVCLSQGGLDRSDVTRAVLDIMEGSEEALYTGCQPIRRNQLLAGFMRDFPSPITGTSFMEARGEGFLNLVRDSEALSGKRPKIERIGEAVKLTIYAADTEIEQ